MFAIIKPRNQIALALAFLVSIMFYSHNSQAVTPLDQPGPAHHVNAE